MRYNDPNRPEPLADLRPESPRQYESDKMKDIAQDGYVCKARRPRVRNFDEIVPDERADRIEGIFSTPSPFDMDSY